MKAKPHPRFEGKLALITGAGSGIGRATALLFGDLGARLVLFPKFDPDLVLQAIEDERGTIVGWTRTMTPRPSASSAMRRMKLCASSLRSRLDRPPEVRISASSNPLGDIR